MGRSLSTYETAGSGDNTIALLHGAACDLTFWNAQVDALSSICKVVLVDLPGHGRSDKPRINYTMKLMAQAVHAVLERTRTSNAILLGHSMGVAVIREFYRTWPERVRALIGLDGPIYFQDPPWQYKLTVWLMHSALYKSLWRSMVFGMMGIHTPDQWRNKIYHTMMAAPKHVVVSALNEMHAPSVARNININVPLQVLNASDYAWGDRKLEDRIQSIAHQVSFAVIENANHFLMVERPRLVNDLILEFVRELRDN